MVPDVNLATHIVCKSKVACSFLCILCCCCQFLDLRVTAARKLGSVTVTACVRDCGQILLQCKICFATRDSDQCCTPGCNMRPWALGLIMLRDHLMPCAVLPTQNKARIPRIELGDVASVALAPHLECHGICLLLAALYSKLSCPDRSFYCCTVRCELSSSSLRVNNIICIAATLSSSCEQQGIFTHSIACML